MALCPLTTSYDYGSGCTSYPGGVKVIAFLESYNKNTITRANGVVTAMALQASKAFRTYRVKKNNSFVVDPWTRSESGAVSYKPSVSLFLPDLQTTTRQESQLLSLNSLIIAWLGNDNVWRMVGYDNYMELATGDANFGTLIADSHKQTLVFNGEDTAPALEINTATATSLGLPLI